MPPGSALSRKVLTQIEEASHCCNICGKDQFTLKRRRLSNLSWCVDVQCDQCGRAGGHPFKLVDHPYWSEYPIFDNGKLDRWYDREYQERLAEKSRRQADYREWLLSSPEWKELRTKVIRRSGSLCEACLSTPATDVHHITYNYGRLPPAWMLRHICRNCHDRFSTPGDDWGPPGDASS